MMIIASCIAFFVFIVGLYWLIHKNFKALSFDVLEKNSKTFLEMMKGHLAGYQESAKGDFDTKHQLIEGSLKQVHETMKLLEMHQRELEKRREGAYASLVTQIEGMRVAEKELKKETSLLTQALRSPQIRGSWGEIHLRRVVELAGLLNHCDFVEQKSLEDAGKVWRPDLVVHLPGQRCIAIDAKTPLSSYLDASDAGDDAIRQKKLQEHALSIRRHIRDLSAKEYWKQLDLAPEYVILFLPAEAFFSAALQSDPELIEMGASQNIIVATPTTLIAILRAVAFTWKQEGLSKSAKEIAKLGQELYERLGVVSEHWGKVGKSLSSAVESYNQSIASMESRVMVSARKLKESGSFHFDLKEPELVDKQTKSIEQPSSPQS